MAQPHDAVLAEVISGGRLDSRATNALLGNMEGRRPSLLSLDNQLYITRLLGRRMSKHLWDSGYYRNLNRHAINWAQGGGPRSDVLRRQSQWPPGALARQYAVVMAHWRGVHGSRSQRQYYRRTRQSLF